MNDLPGDSAVSPAPQDTEEPRPVTLRDRVLSARTLISFGLAAAFIVFVFRNLDLDLREIADNIVSGNPLWIAAGFAAYYSSFPVRAWRWRRLLENAGVRREGAPGVFTIRSLSGIYVLSWFANCLVPAKLGDAYRGYLLRQRGGVSFARTFGTIVAERFIDVLALVGLMALSVLLAFHGHVPRAVQLPLVGGVVLAFVGMLGLGGVALYPSVVLRFVPRRFAAPYERLQEGVLASFSMTGAPGVVAATAVVWAFEGLRVFCVAAAFGVRLSPSEAIFVALLASLLTVVPLTPAGLGVVESGTIIALRLLDVSATNAATLAIVDRGIAYWSVIVVGATLSVVLRKR